MTHISPNVSASFAFSTVLVIFAWLFSMPLASSGGELKANTWLEISTNRKPEPWHFCSAWYIPATGEFMTWGREAVHGSQGGIYELRSLDLKDEYPEWRDSLPIEKEQVWSDGRFPNWDCGCHPARITKDRLVKGVGDKWVGGFSAINRVQFVETEGVKRPTRTFTYHQGSYDTKRDQLVYFTGGKTFAYDAKKREWTDFNVKPPVGCDALSWASMAYDPEGDRLVLFGGAYALNPWGGAQTWLFDFASNEWTKANCAGGVEPRLRCNAQLVYDARNKVMVLFGGDALGEALADTWTLRLKNMSWKEMKPAQSPPAADRYAACFVPGTDKVFLATRSWKRSKKVGVAWLYDAAANVWSALPDELPLADMRWISCGYSPEKRAVVVASPGVGTWLYRPDLEKAGGVAGAPHQMIAPVTAPWRDNQMVSWEKAPEPDRKAHEAELGILPVNQVIDSQYPGKLFQRTWGTATIDTDRGVLLYTGGGHCGYDGTDIACYDVGANRWTLDAPPCKFPDLSGVYESLYGWDYRLRPTPQHLYRWYAYDPVSKLMINCARGHATVEDGFSVQRYPDEPPFAYDRKKHNFWTFLYDPVNNVNYPAVLGRPFGNSWPMALCTTPQGVICKVGGNLFLAKVTRDDVKRKADVKWEHMDTGAPSGDGEMQPLVYDARRNRLLFVAQRRQQEIQVWEYPLPNGAWQEISLQGGTTNMSREIVYDTVNDALVNFYSNSRPRRSGIMILHLGVERKEWKELDVAMPNHLGFPDHAMVYDPVHNVCVMLMPDAGFSGMTYTMLFRHDPKTARWKDSPLAGERD